MGIVLNPVAYRVGYKYSWKDAWYSHRLTYSVFIHDIIAFKTLMIFIFFRYFSYKRAFWLYSHVNIYILNNKIFINLYLYDANEVQMYYDVSRRYRKVAWFRLNARSNWYKKNIMNKKSRIKRLHFFTRTVNFFYELLTYEDINLTIRKDRRSLYNIRKLKSSKKDYENFFKNRFYFFINKKEKKISSLFFSGDEVKKVGWMPWEELYIYRSPFLNMVHDYNRLSVKWWVYRDHWFYIQSFKDLKKREKEIISSKRKKLINLLKDNKKKLMKNKRYFKKFPKRLNTPDHLIKDLKNFKKNRFSKQYWKKKGINPFRIRANNRLLFTFLSFINTWFSKITYMYDDQVFTKRWMRRNIRFFVYLFIRKYTIKLWGNFIQCMTYSLGLNFNVKVYSLNNLSVGAAFISRFIAIGLRNRFDYLDTMIPIRRNLRRQMYGRRWSADVMDATPEEFAEVKETYESDVLHLRDVLRGRMRVLDNILNYKFEYKFKYTYFNSILLRNLIFNKIKNNSLLLLDNNNNKKIKIKIKFLIKSIILVSKTKLVVCVNNMVLFLQKVLCIKILFLFVLLKIYSFYRVIGFILNKKMFFYFLKKFNYSFIYNENCIINKNKFYLKNFIKLLCFHNNSNLLHNFKYKFYLKPQRVFYLYNFFFIYIKIFMLKYNVDLFENIAKKLNKLGKIKKFYKIKIRVKNYLKKTKKFYNKKVKYVYKFKNNEIWINIKNKFELKYKKQLFKRLVIFLVQKSKYNLKKKIIIRENYFFRIKKRQYTINMKNLFINFCSNNKFIYNIFFYTLVNLFINNKYDNFILKSFYNDCNLYNLSNWIVEEKSLKIKLFNKLLLLFSKKFSYLRNKIDNELVKKSKYTSEYFIIKKKIYKKDLRYKNKRFKNIKIIFKKLNYELCYNINKYYLFDLKSYNDHIQFSSDILSFSLKNFIIIMKFFRKLLKKRKYNVVYYNSKFKYFKALFLKLKKKQINYLHYLMIVYNFKKYYVLFKFFFKIFKLRKRNVNNILNYGIKLKKFLNCYEFDKIISYLTDYRIKNYYFFFFNNINNFTNSYFINIISFKKRLYSLHKFKSSNQKIILPEVHKIPLFFFNKTKKMKFFDSNNSFLYGYKFHFVGRFTRKQQSANMWYRLGSLANSSAVANVDYATYSVIMRYSVCTVKVWLYKGRLSPKYKYRIF